MALGKSNRVDGKAFSLKLATKRDGAFLEKPEWEVQTKQPNGEYETLSAEALRELTGSDGPCYDVAGNLISIETRIGSYEDSPIYNVTLSLRDPKENQVYFAGFTVGSSLGRKLTNAILNLKAFDNVQVGLYSQLNKETRKVYGAAALRQGNDTATVKGKYDFKTDASLQPRIFEGKGGKPEKDWTKVDLFLFEQLKAFNEIIKGAKAASQSSEAPSPEGEDDVPQEEGGEKLPF